MEWTLRLVAGILAVATLVELSAAVAISVFTTMAFSKSLASVFIVMGVVWTFAGMFASGPGRLAPPLTTAPAHEVALGQSQIGLSSELYISRAGAHRVALSSLRALDRGAGFMIPAILYGVAILVIGALLVA